MHFLFIITFKILEIELIDFHINFINLVIGGRLCNACVLRFVDNNLTFCFRRLSLLFQITLEIHIFQCNFNNKIFWSDSESSRNFRITLKNIIISFGGFSFFSWRCLLMSEIGVALVIVNSVFMLQFFSCFDKPYLTFVSLINIFKNCSIFDQLLVANCTIRIR